MDSKLYEEVIPEDSVCTVVGARNVYPILEIAYLLTAIDGIVRVEEIVGFRNTAKLLLGEKFCDEETLTFLLSIHSKAQQLLGLLKFYTEEKEKVCAFIFLTKDAIVKIAKESSSVVRRAFSVWIGMCMSDNEFAGIERMAIDELKKVVITVNAKLEHYLSKGFFDKVEEKTLKIKSFEAEVMSDVDVVDQVKIDKLKELIVDFTRMIDSSL